MAETGPDWLPSSCRTASGRQAMSSSETASRSSAVTAPGGFWPRVQKLMPAKPSAGSKYAAIAGPRPGTVRVSLSRPAARRMASPPLNELICPVCEYLAGLAHEYPL